MRGRPALLALVLLAGGGPARADFASEAMLHDLVRSIDASAEWTASAGVVRSEGADTLAERLVFSRQAPDVSVTVERLRLRDLVEGNAGGFTASEIEITGAALASPESEIAIPAASVRDVSIPGAQGVVYDPRHLMAFMAQSYSVMADAEFADFSVPEMRVLTRPNPASAKVGDTAQGTLTYRNLSISGLSDGVMQTSTAGPITFEGKDAEGDVRFEVQSVSSERLDLGAVAHILDDAEYRDGRGDAIWRPLVSKLAYAGLSASGSDGTIVSLANLAIENVDGRQPDKPMAATWDRILDPAIADTAKRDLTLEALQDVVAAWRVGTIRMDGLAIEDAAKNTTAGLSAFTISGLSSEGLDSVILKNLRGESPEGFLNLDSFELAGFVFPGSAALMNFAALESDADPARHAETVRAVFAALPRLSHLGVQGFAGGPSRDEAVAIGLMTLDLADWNDIYAGATDLRIEGVDVPVGMMQLPPEQLQVMNTLGFDRLVLGLSLADRWSPETGKDEATWRMTLQDGADMELTYTLGGITIDWILASTAAAGKTETSSAAGLEMLEGLQLERARLAVTDRSLLDRGFAVAAEKQGLSVDGKAYREQMRGALPFLLSAALPAELSKLISPALQAFMAGGQTLIAEIAPPSPVPLLELADGVGDPTALVNRLGLTVRSEAPAQ